MSDCPVVVSIFRTAHPVKDDVQPPSLEACKDSLINVKECVLQLGKLFNTAARKTEKPKRSVSVF